MTKIRCLAGVVASLLACSAVIAQPAPLGACCIQQGGLLGCTDTSPDDCDARGGEYQGDGTQCQVDGCQFGDTGACCLPDGGCVQVSLDECVAADGQYVGNNTNCFTVFCVTVERGACCIATPPGGNRRHLLRRRDHLRGCLVRHRRVLRRFPVRAGLLLRAERGGVRRAWRCVRR